MSELLHVFLLSVGSFITIFILAKLMGYRQMSEMSMFDYINGITIGSIAAEMATSLEENFMQPLTAMIIYALLTLFLSIITSKSIKLRRFVEGKPIILINNGEIFKENLKKAKIDVCELLVQCRVGGYFDVSKIQTAILEENGKISFLPKSTDRPATPQDLSLNPEQEYMVANVIIDGNIMSDNLKRTGNDEIWLQKQLGKQDVCDVKDVLLATCDISNNLTVFLRNAKDTVKDIFC